MLLRSNPPVNMPKMRPAWRIKIIVLCVLAGGYALFMWHVVTTKPRVLMQRVLIPVDVVKPKVQTIKGPSAPPVPLIEAPVITVPPPHIPVR